MLLTRGKTNLTQLKLKEIKLTYYRIIDDKYVVKLGNGFEFAFNQERQAKAFLNKTSRFLTEQLSFINHIYSSVFLTYRQNYLLFAPNSGKRQAEIFQAERIINDQCSRISESLNKAVWMSNTRNGNYIVFSAFYFCVSALRTVCSELNLLVQRQKLTTLKYQIVNYHNEINLIERGLNEFEQLKAVRVFERARLDDLESIQLSKVV